MAESWFRSNAVRTGRTSVWVRDNAAVGIPQGRLVANGQHPIIITHLAGALGGYGAARTATIALGSAAGGLTVGSAAQANDTGWVDVSDWYVGDGGSAIFGYYDMSGQCYFGRSANSGGSTIESGYGGAWTLGGQLGGGMFYVQAPSSPGTPVLASPEPGKVTLSWSGPADNGGTGVTGYRIKRATDAAMTQNVTYINVGNVGSYTDTSVVSGTRYYYQVAAKNAVTAPADTSSVYSGVANVLVQSGGRRWDGAAEVPISALMRWDGSQEVAITTAVRWDGTAEVPLSS